MSTGLFNTLVSFAAAVVTFAVTYNFAAAAAVFSLGNIALSLLNPGTPSADLNDIRATKSSYGEFIPIPYNNVRLGSHLVWASTVRAKKRGTGGYEYGQDLLYEICETTILGQHFTPVVQRIWLNHQLVYDVRPGAQLSNIVGIISGSLNVQVFTFYDGAPDQEPIPLLVQNDGSGKVPAYRGVLTILCENCPLHLYGNAIPNLEVELIATTVLPNDTSYELFLSDHVRGSSSLTPGDIVTGGTNNLFTDWANSKVYSIPSTGLSPQTYWYTIHDLQGNLISKTELSTLLTLSGDKYASAQSGTQIGNFVYVTTWTDTGPTNFSKLDLATGQQVAYMTPNSNVLSTGQQVVVPFQIGATNYIAILMDEPSGSPNIEIINADTMVSVATGDVSPYTSLYGNILIPGDNPDPNSINLYFLHGSSDDLSLGLEKITWSTVSGFTIAHIDTLLPSDFDSGWDELFNPDVGCWDPTDNKLVVVVEGDNSSGFDPINGVSYHCVLAKIDPSNGNVSWTYRMEGPPQGWDGSHNAFVRTIISDGLLLIQDYLEVLEVDTATGNISQRHWTGYADGECGVSIGDAVSRNVALVYSGTGQKNYSAIGYMSASPRKSFALELGGETAFSHWQDPQTDFAYVIRERWDFQGYELAKIDVTTGQAVASLFEAYSDPAPTPAYKALNFNASGVIGSYQGSKLYVWTSQFLGGSSYNTGLIEFDKATLARTNFFDFGTTFGAVPALFDNDGGGQCMDQNGDYLVRIMGWSSSGSAPNILPDHAWIVLFDTIFQTAQLIDLHTKGMDTDNCRISRGCFFAGNGSLNIVATPCALGTNTQQSGPCILFSYTILGGLTPDLILLSQHTLEADDAITYPQVSGQFSKCMGASYHLDVDVAYIFMDKDSNTGYALKPVILWNRQMQQSSHLISDFPGNFYGSNFDPNKNGWATSDNKYLNFWSDTGGANDTSSKFNVLDVSNITIASYNIDQDWYPIDELREATSFHSYFNDDTKQVICSIPSNGNHSDTYNSARVSAFFIYPDQSALISLETICKDQSERAGTLVGGDVDYSAFATTYPTGYSVTTRQTARSNIENLQVAYLFDIVESDWQLKGIFREGGTSIVTVPEDDVVSQSDTERAFTFKQSSQMELARWIDLSYYDIDRDYQVSIASARIGGTSADDRNAQKVNAPVVMHASEAANAAIRIIEAGWAAQVATKFQLPFKYLAYEPSDVITLTRNGETFEVRISSENLGANWSLEIETEAHDSGAYAAIGVPNSNTTFGTPAGGGASGGSLVIVSPPTMLVMDTAMLSETDDSVGLYLTAIPQVSQDQGAQWYGADLERSLTSDFATPNTVGAVTLAPVSGICQNILASPKYWESWDRTNTLTIKLTSGTLNNVSDETQLWQDGSLNLALVGNELIQFADCEQLQKGTWRLYNLIRGVMGTEQFVDSHSANESFFLIDSTKYVNYTYSNLEIGLTRYYRASNDSPNKYSPTVTSQQTTRRLMPYAPFYFSGSRDGSNNLTVSFLRRSRFRATSLLFDPALGESTADYEADIYNGTNVVRTITTTVSAGGSVIDPTLMTVYYSATDQTTDFGSPQANVHMKIYQKNAIVGRGYPGDTIQ